MRARLLSLAIHLGVVAMLLMVSHQAVTPGGREAVRHIAPYVTRLIEPLLDRARGGGGEQSLLPASRGRLPKPAPRQFIPPSAVPRETTAVLVMEPTLVMPPDVRLPMVNLAQFGDPLGVDGPASNGPGSRGGIGRGSRGGVGDDAGPGYQVNGSGLSGAGRVTAPALLYKVEPEFSEEARKAKYQGTVILTIEVGEDGKPQRFRIVSGLGLGLDEKAIEAVSQWRFRPALRNGRPVRAPATIEVNFRLL